MSIVKFAHIRDPRDTRRVLTLARRIVEDGGVRKLQLGYAINRVSYEQNYFGELEVVSDAFNRKLGNRIALGRLEAAPVVFDLKADEHPMDAIRSFFKDASHQVLESGKVPFVVKRVVDADREFYELSHSPKTEERLKAAKKFS